MAATRLLGKLAAAGSTGNATHASVAVPSGVDVLLVEFEVTAIGATPTVTYDVQVSLDDPAIPDASSDWVSPFGLKSSSATEADIAGTVTTVSVEAWTLDLLKRPCRKVRLVTSANTNVTYEADLHGVDLD